MNENWAVVTDGVFRRYDVIAIDGEENYFDFNDIIERSYPEETYRSSDDFICGDSQLLVIDGFETMQWNVNHFEQHRQCKTWRRVKNYKGQPRKLPIGSVFSKPLPLP